MDTVFLCPNAYPLKGQKVQLKLLIVLSLGVRQLVSVSVWPSAKSAGASGTLAKVPKVTVGGWRGVGTVGRPHLCICRPAAGEWEHLRPILCLLWSCEGTRPYEVM